VFKNSAASPILKTATSPAAASLNVVVQEGDILVVVIDYPAGFKAGNNGSEYQLICNVYSDGWLWR
jgi:hypothetical protein